MKIADILKKIVNKEELTEAESAFLKSYREPEPPKPPDTKELDAVKKERDDLKAKIEEAANAGKTELEKLQAKFEASEKKLADIIAERDRINTEHATLKRRNRVNELAAKHGCEDAEYLDYLAGKRGINLDDDAKAEEFLTGLKTEAPKYFKATTKPGPGNPPPKDEQPKDKHQPDKVGGIIDMLNKAPEAK